MLCTVVGLLSVVSGPGGSLFHWSLGVAAVGALPLGFKVKLGLVRGKYLPAGLHAAEASHVSISSLASFLCCHWSGGLV